MSSLKVTLCTGILAAAALFPTASPAFAADDEAGLTVTPTAPPPGSDVRLRVADCAERTAIAVSAVFVADVRLTASGGMLVGESRIRSTVTAGTYDVRVACGGTGRVGTITVGQQGDRQPRPARPETPASPVAPVEAGGGGTARLAAESRETGPGTGHVVTGLVLAGVAAVAVVLGGVHRRSRRSG
ncbi:hypothetical protein [Streptomyces sp. DH24]|uniref:hypothetical protein n=1 Tax=Streptomyces sp. DH24 TaxID=3040123 RepID=UPI002442C637|nr:hypothetical protein [Streptomyces sp. DH24]MDG9721048.1 hypothetical protein [Streptomyces sp. DH24]